MKTKLKEKLWKMILFLGMLTIAFIAQGNSNKAFAASKKYVYMTSMVKYIDEESTFGQCNKITLKGKKLTLKGSLLRGKSENAVLDGRYKSLRYKKRTFKLSSGCKFYSRGGDEGTKKIKKKKLIKIAKRYNGLALLVYTNKKGKVYKIILSS